MATAHVVFERLHYTEAVIAFETRSGELLVRKKGKLLEWINMIITFNRQSRVLNARFASTACQLRSNPLAGRRMMKIIFIGALAIASGLVTACGNQQTQEAAPSSGPCVVQFLQPVVTIKSAKGRTSGAPIARLTLSSFTVNGTVPNLNDWLYGPAPQSNISVDHGVVYCDVPCGFGSADGRYIFVADAPGYRTSNVTIDAHYATTSGNCPAIITDGTVAHLVLGE